MKSHLIIGTRGSKLALWQANFTKDLLEKEGITSELKIIKTRGDRIQHIGFDKMEGKGFFTKEIEEELLRGDIDVAVHSMKDLPTNSPEGLIITAVSYRETPSDWLVICKDCKVNGEILNLKKNAKVGTSSARRKAQLLDFRPDLQMVDIRGNVPTRLEKLKHQDLDAVVLAGAGLTRLEIDLSDFHVIDLNPKEFVPAPAQGVLAYQTTVEDRLTRKILTKIHNKQVSECTNIERKILNLLDGGCKTPFGAYCTKDLQGNYHVIAALAESWNGPVKRVSVSSSTKHGLAETVLKKLQEELKITTVA